MKTIFMSDDLTVPPRACCCIWNHSQQGCYRSKNNIVLDDVPHPINEAEKDLTRKERANLTQLRSGYSRLLGCYKSTIKKDTSLNVCADCGKTPHDVKHLFDCVAHLRTLIPSDLWSKPMDFIREFSYLEAETWTETNHQDLTCFQYTYTGEFIVQKTLPLS